MTAVNDPWKMLEQIADGHKKWGTQFRSPHRVDVLHAAIRQVVEERREGIKQESAELTRYKRKAAVCENREKGRKMKALEDHIEHLEKGNQDASDEIKQLEELRKS